MLKVNEFRNYITSFKTEIEEIKASETVMDDSQLSKFIEKQKTGDFIILGIVPKHSLKGNIDALKSDNKTSLLVLQKIVRSEHLHEGYLDLLADAQNVTKKVIDKILSDFKDESRCDFIRYLIPGSFDINPIGWLNSCDGYEIDFSLNTTF